MSDIGLQITWWQIALWMLALAFWPLTALALAAAFWVWRRRTSRVARIVAGIVAAFWIGSAGTNLAMQLTRLKNHLDYVAQLRARQTTLVREEVVAGMRLPAGTVITHSVYGGPADVSDLDLPAPTEIHGILLRGHVSFSGGALDGAATLAKDARVDGAPCSAATPLRFASGRLVECDLIGPSRIKGVPCNGHIDLQVGLRCELAGDYTRFRVTWRAKTDFTDFGDLVWFHVGALAPSLQAFGAPLRPESEVQYAYGRLASVDLHASPAPFRGCQIDLVLVQKGGVFGRSTGQCALALRPAVGGLYIPLPATALSSY